MVLSNAMYETFENLMALRLLLKVFVKYWMSNRTGLAAKRQPQARSRCSKLP